MEKEIKKQFGEYCGTKIVTLMEGEPTCRAEAVIPTIVVENVDGIKQMTNTLVRVENINSTFYVDDKHRVTKVWAGPIEKSNYDFENNPDNIRGQLVIDKITRQAFYYYLSGDKIEFMIKSE